MLPSQLQCDSLQRHLEIVNDELKEQQQKFTESQRHLQIADEDLVTYLICICAENESIHASHFPLYRRQPHE